MKLTVNFIASSFLAAALSSFAAMPTQAAHLEYYDSAAAPATAEQFQIFCGLSAAAIGNCDPGNDGIDILASPLFAQPGDYSDDDNNLATQNGQLFNLPSNNTAGELAFVNANLLAGDGPFSSGVTTELGSGDDGEDFTFSSIAKYIVVKVGGGTNALDTGLLVNLSGGRLFFRFDMVTPGNGLSHYTEYGVASQIPLPAAGWLLLTGLAGLGFAAKRRKAA